MTACQALQLFSPPGWSENWATIATGIARPASPSAKRVPRPLPGPAVPPAPFTFAAPAVVPCGTPCGSSPLLACGSVNGPRPITCGPEDAARNTPRPSGCSATFGCASSSLCAATAGLTMSPSFLRLNPLIRPWPYALDIGSLPLLGAQPGPAPCRPLRRLPAAPACGARPDPRGAPLDRP